MTRTCVQCKEDLPEDEFWGRSVKCKVCFKERQLKLANETFLGRGKRELKKIAETMTINEICKKWRLNADFVKDTFYQLGIDGQQYCQSCRKRLPISAFPLGKRQCTSCREKRAHEGGYMEGDAFYVDMLIDRTAQKYMICNWGPAPTGKPEYWKQCA